MRIKNLVSTLAAAVMMLGAFDMAVAQLNGCRSIVLPNGTVLTCNVVNGQKVYTDPAGNIYNPTSTGVGQFTVTSTTTNPCSATLAPNAINVTSVDPVLGTITTTLDPTRVALPSVIRSILAGSEFPATEDIYFFARATISSRPGKAYRSIQQVHLFSQNVRSFAPHVNEPFTLAGQVQFEDVTLPGVVAFTLTQLTLQLN